MFSMERADELIRKGQDMTGEEIKNLSPEETLCALWGEAGLAIVKYVNTIDTPKMTQDEFLNHCTACGGNWGGMLLTGIHKLYPEVWDLIPDKMGVFAWRCLCDTLELLNIKGD